MSRYFAAHKKGKVQASPELVKMWGSSNGRFLAESIDINCAEGGEIRKLLLANGGDMAAVNLRVERQSKQARLLL